MTDIKCERWSWNDYPGSGYCIETAVARIRITPYFMPLKETLAIVDAHNESLKRIAVELERISEMHQTEVRENRELWEEIQRLKGAE